MCILGSQTSKKISIFPSHKKTRREKNTLLLVMKIRLDLSPLLSILIKLKFRLSVCLSVCVSVRNLSPRRGSTAGTHIWYWHEAQCPADVLVLVSFRLVASGPSYGRFKGRRSKNGQKCPKFFFKVIHSKSILNDSGG